jgi:hypothetical protein
MRGPRDRRWLQSRWAGADSGACPGGASGIAPTRGYAPRACRKWDWRRRPGCAMSQPPFGRPPRGGREAPGAIAQLGERLNGIQEVTGSIPVSSTEISMR